MLVPGPRARDSQMDYLAKLNPDQRAAVEHGVADADTRPLLVIAGAGSGKTDTLAHRVAHLVMNGGDPHRILLLTFSRRAAAEMERRAERILNRASGINASAGLIWSGTFHAIGAREHHQSRFAFCSQMAGSRVRLTFAALPLCRRATGH